MTAPGGPRPSYLHLPPGPWTTVLDCLCARFPAIERAVWLERMQRGRVLDAEGRPLASDHPYREGLRIHYFREVAAEIVIPFEETLLHVDEHLVVADKPHFLPVTPSGPYVEQCLLARLIRRLGNPDLVPIHRIDRLTAGLVLFSAHPASRGRYQALFRERQIDKEYEAIAAALPGLQLPHVHRSRLVPGEPFFRTREVPGPANSETRIERLECLGEYWRYRLQPVSGRKHQLRVHMAALGAPICNDPFYPVALPSGPDDYSKPLLLLARRLGFSDPLSGERRQFSSGLQLQPPAAARPPAE